MDEDRREGATVSLAKAFAQREGQIEPDFDYLELAEDLLQRMRHDGYVVVPAEAQSDGQAT